MMDHDAWNIRSWWLFQVLLVFKELVTWEAVTKPTLEIMPTTLPYWIDVFIFHG
jgi:hypothetical protein